MQVSVEYLEDRFFLILPQYAEALQLSMPDTIRQTARGVVRNVIRITPPSSELDTGSAARAAGENKIKRDLSRIFIPRVLKGHRQIKVVFGHRLSSPITVPTKELYPEVHDIYRRALHGSRGRIGFRASRMYYYVDQQKVAALFREKKKQVGKLASAWVASAAALGVRVPAWISRHGTARGDYTEHMESEKPFVLIEARIPTESQLGPAMNRLLAHAMNYQMNAMKRRLRYLLMQKGKEAGMRPQGPMPPPPVDTPIDASA